MAAIGEVQALGRGRGSAPARRRRPARSSASDSPHASLPKIHAVGPASGPAPRLGGVEQVVQVDGVRRPSAARTTQPRGAQRARPASASGGPDGDRQVEQAARGGPDALGVVDVDAARRSATTASAPAASAARTHGAGVARVADPGEHGDQGRPRVGRRRRQDVAERPVDQVADGHQALRVHRVGQRRQHVGPADVTGRRPRVAPRRADRRTARPPRRRRRPRGPGRGRPVAVRRACSPTASRTACGPSARKRPAR